jgi:iron complex transport system substrate-binding protein
LIGKKGLGSGTADPGGPLGGPPGQIAYILGARSQLCAVTQSLKLSQLVGLMDPSVKDLAAPRSTSGQINVEELIVADPQLVISGDLDGSIIEKKTRIPVAYFKSDMSQSFALMMEEVRFYGRVFRKESRACFSLDTYHSSQIML